MREENQETKATSSSMTCHATLCFKLYLRMCLNLADNHELICQ
ncbi:hypothetical protein AAZX31_15G150000 [Glycine max]